MSKRSVEQEEVVKPKTKAKRSAAESKLIAEHVATFFSKKAEFNSLSNFHIGEVVVEGRRYPHGEAAFHGEKFLLFGKVEYAQQFQNRDITPQEAKRRGGAKGLPLSEAQLSTWTDISPQVQRVICFYKFIHDKQVRDDLLRSGNRILLHQASRTSREKMPSRFWEGSAYLNDDGTIEILGQNMLGNIWMELRDRYLSAT
jgi:ribA/ribD-fused uncharacterized protein